MTVGSPEPVLVLGLGNLLLCDDGAGLELLDRLRADAVPNVEYADGGTQGIALLGVMENRRAVLICDAVGLGGEPGTVHVVEKAEVERLRARGAGSAHEGNALGLLQACRLTGSEPDELVVVGIEPEAVRTGIGLSPCVEAALDSALHEARAVLRRWTEYPGGDAPD